MSLQDVAVVVDRPKGNKVHALERCENSHLSARMEIAYEVAGKKGKRETNDCNQGQSTPSQISILVGRNPIEDIDSHDLIHLVRCHLCTHLFSLHS